MYQRISTLSLLTLVFLLGACNQDPTSGAGFRLPDGDASQGREVFLYMQCNECHSIADVELPAIPGSDPPYVELGGRVATVKTYGDLVTSIINPSHRLAPGYAKEKISEDGESNMYIYNRHMTVQELIDLTAFLQAHYEVVPPHFDYRMYPH